MAQTVAFPVRAVAFWCAGRAWLPSGAAAFDHRTHGAVTSFDNDRSFNDSEHAATFAAN